MSDATPAPADPIAAMLTAEHPKPAPAPAVPPNPVQAADLPPAALKERLDQVRSKAAADVLSELGGAKIDDIKAKLVRLQELEDATLSDRERSEKQIADLRVQAAEAERYRKLFGEQTAVELAALSEEQRAAVQAYAGEDPVEQHRMIRAFHMASGAVAPVAGTPASEVAPSFVPPATTVPAGTAPSPASGLKTKAEEWAELRERDPIAGQLFHQQHAREIHV